MYWAPPGRGWRALAQQRRRARRRYLAFVHARWSAAGAPRTYSRPTELLVTLLWLAAPAALAVGFFAALGRLPAALGPAPPDPALALLLVPVLGLWLLRQALRR